MRRIATVRSTVLFALVTLIIVFNAAPRQATLHRQAEREVCTVMADLRGRCTAVCEECLPTLVVVWSDSTGSFHLLLPGAVRESIRPAGQSMSAICDQVLHTYCHVDPSLGFGFTRH